MRWAAASSVLPATADAALAAARSARAVLGEGAVDLALVFFTASHVPMAETIAATLRAA